MTWQRKNWRVLKKELKNALKCNHKCQMSKNPALISRSLTGKAAGKLFLQVLVFIQISICQIAILFRVQNNLRSVWCEAFFKA